MPTLTFNPDANPETTSVDGRVYRFSVNEPWATIRAGAGNGSSDTVTDATTPRLDATATTDQFGQLRRNIYLFDVSDIPAGATIDSVTFEIFANGKSDTFGSQEISLVDSSPASNTALVDSDYGNVGTTLQATAVPIASITVGAYNTWTLNATGIARVQSAADGDGIVKLGLVLECDRANTPPTWSFDGQTANIGADYAEGPNPPKLNVTYSGGITTSTSTTTSTTTSTSSTTSTTSSTTTSTSTTSSTSTTTTSTSTSTSSTTSSTTSTSTTTTSTSTSTSSSTSTSTSTTTTTLPIQPYRPEFSIGLVRPSIERID